ncbi:hypothetical protein [Ktedonosporobacter rubrisoli]|nr:hypothetical protein [Ktedonosporobacter rubrisoli]
MEFIVVLLLFLVLALAALRWGADSREPIHETCWENPKHAVLFHPAHHD